MLARRLSTTFFRTFVNKVSPQKAVIRTEEALDILNKRVKDWESINKYSVQKTGVGEPDIISHYLTDCEQIKVAAVAKSMGISLDESLVTTKDNFREKLIELNTFEIKSSDFKPAKK